MASRGDRFSLHVCRHQFCVNGHQTVQQTTPARHLVGSVTVYTLRWGWPRECGRLCPALTMLNADLDWTSLSTPTWWCALTCVGRCQAASQHCVNFAASAISSQRPSSSGSSLLWFSVDSTMVMAHWSGSRLTLSVDSSRCKTQRRD